MAEKKITKRENFENIKAFLAENGKTEWAEVMAHEIELLNRKSSKSATLSPAQKDAIAVGEIVRDVLSECPNEKGMTVGAILKDERIKSYAKADGNSVSSQMITAILSKNTADFKRTLDKKVAYYSLNYGVDEGEVEGV
jgi:uncharacterized protein YqeY